MEVTNSSRFVIEKNAIDFLKVSQVYPKILDQWIAKREQFSFNYQWDKDFKQFFRIDKDKITHIINTYQDIDFLLKNIYFEKIFSNITIAIIQIFEKIAWNKEQKLSIINISPLEWAIIWSILQEFWLKNVVYNFNRNLSLNSTSKTLEWILYVFAYNNSNYFKEKIKEIISDIQKKHFDIQNDNNYIIIDENNNNEQYEHLKIDNYLKTQIWMKEQKNVYRLDKYPDEKFLLTKNIKYVYIFDNDNDSGKIIEFYQWNIKNISFQEYTYNLIQEKRIWYYEDYLISKNDEYLNYKKTIETKALNNYQIYSKTIKESNDDDIYGYIKSNYDKFNANNKEENYHYIPYFVLFIILTIWLLMNDLPKWTNYNNSSSSSSHIWWYYGWWIWDSNTISTKKTEWTSIIKSFWWWWFKKWWW